MRERESKAAEKPSNCRLSHVCHINSTLDWRRSTEQVKNYYYLAAAPSTAPSRTPPLATTHPLTHSTTQHLLSSGSSECFGPRVRKSISFMFFCWNFMGERSSFSFFLDQRESRSVRKRETDSVGKWTVQLRRISSDNAAVFRMEDVGQLWGGVTWLSWAAFLSTKINLIFSLSLSLTRSLYLLVSRWRNRI